MSIMMSDNIFCDACGRKCFYEEIICDAKSKSNLCYGCFHNRYPNHSNYFYDLLNDSLEHSGKIDDDFEITETTIDKLLKKLHWWRMGYVMQNTFYVRNEKILFVTTRHWISLFWPITLSVFTCQLNYWFDVSLSNYVYALMLFGSAAWTFRTIVDLLEIEIGVTNKRIMCSDDIKLPGIRFNDSMTPLVGLVLEKVGGVSVKQNIFGKLFNYGTIIVHGINESGEAIHFIKNPLLFQQKVNEIISGVFAPANKSK